MLWSTLASPRNIPMEKKWAAFGEKPNYLSLFTGVKKHLRALLPTQGMSQGRKIGLRLEKNPNFSPQPLKPKAIAHRFWFFSWASLGLPWNFGLDFTSNLFVGDVMPPKTTGVHLECESSFGRIYSKIQRKIKFFGLFLK